MAAKLPFDCGAVLIKERQVNMAKILSVIPYEFYPPRYGGALRCFYLLREMAIAHEVVLITVQPLSDFQAQGYPPFPTNVKVISITDAEGYKSIFNVLPSKAANAINSRMLRRNLFRKGNLFLLKIYPSLKGLLRNGGFDFIYYENLESYGLLHTVAKRFSPGIRQIYDAHNVDSELWEQQAVSFEHQKYKEYAAAALATERDLNRWLSLCICCSVSDQLKLDALNNGRLPLRVVPNGVDCTARPFDNNTGKHQLRNILFCGALDYAPNAEAVLWFFDQIFPLILQQIPSIKFTVIGKMNDAGPYEAVQSHPSVDFVGPVDDVVPYYLSSSILVVPLLSGSGTRLKILEAMSMGNPVVSTKIGAEGIEAADGEHLLLADDPVAFAKHIIALLKDELLFNQIRTRAYELVRNKYDWTVAGTTLRQAIDTITELKVH